MKTYNKTTHERYLKTENGRKKHREAEKKYRERTQAKVKMLHEIRTVEEIEAYIANLNTNWQGDVK